MTFYFSLLVVFLVPLFFLPLTPNFFEFNKFHLLFFASVFIFLLLVLRGFVAKKFILWGSAFDLPVFLFLLAYLLSAVIVPTNRFLPLFSSAGIILTLTLFYLAFTQISVRDNRSWLQALIASSFVLSWLAVFSYLQAWPQLNNFPFLKNQTFTPAGDFITLFTFQIILLPATVIFGLKSKITLNKILYFLAAVLNLLSLGIIASLIFQKTLTLQLLPYSTGWWIGTEVFKNAKSLFFGFGPEGFLAAFSQFRPVSYNATPLWNTYFYFSSNYYLQILTTTGVLGLLSLLFLLFNFANKAFKINPKNDLLLISKLVFVLFVLIFLALPVGFLALFVFYLFLAVLAQKSKKEKVLPFNQIVKVIFLFFVFFLIVLSYFQARIWFAEKVFADANLAARENRGLDTYNKSQQAIQLNPFQEKYHLFLSQISWLMANNLANKKDLTDDDRKIINELVAQSIFNIKKAISLNPQNPLYWQMLANIYRNLINNVNDAQNWAIASYAQAIRTDPVNPALRLDLGGLFYSLGNYESAIDQFKRAIELKPDYANAYYNLSWAYKQSNNPVQAFLSMKQVLALVNQGSEDFNKASKELEELYKLVPDELKTASPSASKQPETQEQKLTQPEILPSSLPTGNIKLPKEAAPEVNPETIKEATQSAEASASPEPAKTVPDKSPINP